MRTLKNANMSFSLNRENLLPQILGALQYLGAFMNNQGGNDKRSINDNLHDRFFYRSSIAIYFHF